MAEFRKAERKRVKIKLAMTGPSGAGKTFSALELATGLGKKIALIDTENESASLYADRFDFDTLEISPPYTIEKYMQAVKAAEKGGFDVLVIDTISHAWAGEGGLLAKKEALDARGGNSYTNWNKITKEQELFKALLLTANIHLICTMRSKQDYILVVNEKGKQEPKKVGMAPVQREGMEYEFTTVFDISMDHHAATSKDRTGLFDGELFKISKETGEKINAWLNSAKAIEPNPAAKAPSSPPPPRQEEKPASAPPAPKKSFEQTLAEHKWTMDQARQWLNEKFKITNGVKPTTAQVDELMAVVKMQSPEEALFMVLGS